jgi:hypothetical protein
MKEKRTTLRVATPPDADRAARVAAFNEDCEAALRSVLAQEPIAVCIIYETAARTGYVAIPASEAVAVGLIHIASGMTGGDLEDNE